MAIPKERKWWEKLKEDMQMYTGVAGLYGQPVSQVKWRDIGIYEGVKQHYSKKLRELAGQPEEPGQNTPVPMTATEFPSLSMGFINGVGQQFALERDKIILEYVTKGEELQHAYNELLEYCQGIESDNKALKVELKVVVSQLERVRDELFVLKKDYKRTREDLERFVVQYETPGDEK